MYVLVTICLELIKLYIATSATINEYLNSRQSSSSRCFISLKFDEEILFPCVSVIKLYAAYNLKSKFSLPPRELRPAN